MDFLTNIVYTLLAYSPELLFTYVIVAAIIVFCGTDVDLEGISGRKNCCQAPEACHIRPASLRKTSWKTFSTPTANRE